MQSTLVLDNAAANVDVISGKNRHRALARREGAQQRRSSVQKGNQVAPGDEKAGRPLGLACDRSGCVALAGGKLTQRNRESLGVHARLRSA